uniref:Uncharacterized protein n=1 Tax=Anopheles maculatus TaxID=74869 RepID=A0A182SBB6_9DIPT
MCTILAPNYDLIDFKLCDERLWTLWCNVEGETQALVYELNPKDAKVGEIGQNVWSPIILENISDKEHPALEVGVDLKDVYCNRIFQSGSFPDKVIRKSLTMFNRNAASITTSTSAINHNMLRLKRYALSCIESQLQQECTTMRQNGPLDNEQIQEISNGLWEKLYLYCVQYRYESSRPIGLFVCEGMTHKRTSHCTVGIIRKKNVSFFRVCDDLEVAFNSPTSYDHYAPKKIALLKDGTLKHYQEMMMLVTFLGEVEQTLTIEQRHRLDSFLHQRRESESSDIYSSFIGATQNQLLVHIISPLGNGPLTIRLWSSHGRTGYRILPDHFPNILPAFLQRVSDLPKAIEALLQYVIPLNRTTYLVPEEEEEASHEPAVYSNFELTSEVALTTAKQLIQLRYLLLRNLLLLQHMIQSHCNFHYRIIDAIQSTIRPDTENLLRCYHVMNWIAQTRLDIDWTKCNKIAVTLPLNIRASLTLLQAYAISQINEEISSGLNTLSSARATEAVASISLTQCANTIIAFICPSSDDFLFGEWLSQNDLHVHIDEYVRLLSNWCEWNSCSSKYAHMFR